MKKYDVVIIGGGIIACASAYYLAKAGASVALLERSQINAQASGRNAGSLHFQLEYRLIQNEAHLQQQLPSLIPLTLAAIKQWQGLERELEADLGLSMSGGLMLAETDQQMALLQRKAELENKYGLGVELLSRQQVLSRAPYLSDQIQGAILCQQEGHCNPRLLAPAFAQKAQQLGVDIFTQTEVQQIQKNSQGWIVSAQKIDAADPDFRLGAGKIVNAAGAWSQQVANMVNVHLPIFPVALTMSVTTAVPKFMHQLIQHVGEKLSLKQVADGNVLIGGGWAANLVYKNGLWQAKTKANINPQSLQKNLSLAAKIVPLIGKLSLLRSWTGITGVTADQLPIIGELKEARGFYVAAGGSGFTYGPVYARLLSEQIIDGLANPLLEAFSPDRFSHINMFMGVDA